MMLKRVSIHQILFCKISTSRNLKEKLFSQDEKIKKLSMEMQLKPLTLAYENFVIYDLENVIIETFVTKLNQKISIGFLISFSGETKTENKLLLIKPSSKPKFDLKKDV